MRLVRRLVCVLLGHKWNDGWLKTVWPKTDAQHARIVATGHTPGRTYPMTKCDRCEAEKDPW